MFPHFVFYHQGASGFINGFLVCYSIVTGAILGVMLVDYSVVRKRELSIVGLYAKCGNGGAYEYSYGFSGRAALAMTIAVLPCLPGLVHVAQHGFAVGNGEHSHPWVLVYDLAWPVTVVLSGGTHVLLHRLLGPPQLVDDDDVKNGVRTALLPAGSVNTDVYE